MAQANAILTEANLNLQHLQRQRFATITLARLAARNAIKRRSKGKGG